MLLDCSNNHLRISVFYALKQLLVIIESFLSHGPFLHIRQYEFLNIGVKHFLHGAQELVVRDSSDLPVKLVIELREAIRIIEALSGFRQDSFKNLQIFLSSQIHRLGKHGLFQDDARVNQITEALAVEI